MYEQYNIVLITVKMTATVPTQMTKAMIAMIAMKHHKLYALHFLNADKKNIKRKRNKSQKRIIYKRKNIITLNLIIKWNRFSLQYNKCMHMLYCIQYEADKVSPPILFLLYSFQENGNFGHMTVIG